MVHRNRLMLCAGDIRRDGWATLDANPARGCVFVATIPPLPAEVKAIAWDEIEWIHGITSLYPWEALVLLDEIRAILGPVGKLTLEQPDFSKAKEFVAWVFGDPIPCDPLHMNRWAYTPDSLSDMLHRTGFSRVEILPAQHHLPERDFRMEAYK